MITLSEAVWGRADRVAVAVIRDCVVALLLRGKLPPGDESAPDPAARERLTVAVRAILRLSPPDIPTPTADSDRSADR